MKKIYKILIFTDLDGSLLHRDTFEFDLIKDYLKQLLSKGIFIIPNTSKTEKEILDFNNELGSNFRAVRYRKYLLSLISGCRRNTACSNQRCIGPADGVVAL